MTENIIKVFLDSNVILSGIVSDKGSPRIILDILSLKMPFIVGMTGEYNLIEIESNLANKIPDAILLYNEYLLKINFKIIKIPSPAEIKNYSGCTSDKDIPVLVSAINGKADYLITGDKKDFDKLKAKDDYKFKIMNPSEFIKEIIPELLISKGELKTKT
jgi:putative PIN family toxin of toxin-antitoxin system